MELTPEESEIRHEAYRALRYIHIVSQTDIAIGINDKIRDYLDILERKLVSTDWSISFTLADIRDAFIAGAKEVKDNSTATDYIIDRSSDAYSKLIQLNKTERCDGVPVEYDGAFKCTKCGAEWGAIYPPNPKTHKV